MQTIINLSEFKNDEDQFLSNMNAQIENWDMIQLSDSVLDGIKRLDVARNKALMYLKRHDKNMRNYAKTGAIESTNFKLHELSYHVYQQSDKIRELFSDENQDQVDNIFYTFCDDEWRNFEELMDGCNPEYFNVRQNLEYYQDSIGRTSFFYWKHLSLDYINQLIYDEINSNLDFYGLIDLDNYSPNHSESKIDSTVSIVQYILDDNSFRNHDGDIRESRYYDQKMIWILEEIENTIKDMERFSELYNIYSSDSDYKDAKTLYRYLNNFKKHSIENFDEWLKCYVENFK